MEIHDFAIVDISNAFMQAEMDEVVHEKLERKMANLLVQLNSGLYDQYLHHAHGRPILYLQLKKTLYGTFKAA
jgi:hypothetical protein